MTKVTLDQSKMLGFRLLESDETADDVVVMGGKSGKATVPGPSGDDMIGDAMALSAKFGKEGKPVPR